MNTGKFDQVLASIREEAIEGSTEAAAASRVRTALFGSEDSPSLMQGGGLHNCAGFQALIPTYLNRTLAPAKSLLLMDHIHQCVACRQALETARSGKNLRVLRRPKAVSTEVSPATRWTIAAMLAVCAAAGTFGLVRTLMVPAGARASVQTVHGILYAVAGASSTPVFSGRDLDDRQIVRTAKESTAMLKLTDGSQVEMNERSQIFVTREVRGTTIHLDHGNVIVHAAKQRNGALYVRTADAEVMVRGTIFAVTAGTKGSRVSVVEGSVKVDHGSQSQMLKPGEQATTGPSVENVPVQDEIAWSRDSAQYLAILGELSGLQKQIERIPAQGLRTHSKLLAMVPENTLVYAAIPNIGSTLGEANRLFEERVQSSPVLQQWWKDQGPNSAQLTGMVNKVKTFSDYLGDEIVLAVTSGETSGPLILAEVKRPGLKEFLAAEKMSFDVMDNPAQLRTASGAQNRPRVYVANGLVAFTPQGDILKDLAGRLENPGAGPGIGDRGFQQRIEQAYAEGAGWLFAANLDAMAREHSGRFRAGRAQRNALAATGMNGVRYLIVERKDVSGQTRNTATLGFNGNRQGMASWLAAPGPMSTLDFVSPDASLAGSFVIKNPGAMLAELIAQAGPELLAKLDEVRLRTGVDVTHDIADPLGGELTFAVDGPLLPIPSWKLAVEVYSPDRLEWAFEKLIDALNHTPDTPVTLQLTKSVEKNVTYYTVKPSGGQASALGVEVDYVFVDGYLLAAANRGLLNSAIQNRSTGFTLARSEKFRALLPNDANPNFSGIVYHNVGSLVGPLANGLKRMTSITADQSKAMDALQSNSAPGLIYAYADQDKITIAANGSLFGFSLDTLALPKVFENIMRQKR